MDEGQVRVFVQMEGTQPDVHKAFHIMRHVLQASGHFTETHIQRYDERYKFELTVERIRER